MRCRRDGEHIKAVARDEGVAPNTVRKYLRSDEPPRRKAPQRAHLLDPYQSHILGGHPKAASRGHLKTGQRSVATFKTGQ